MIVVTDGDGTYFGFEPNAMILAKVPDDMYSEDIERFLKDHRFRRTMETHTLHVWEATV